jgi:hypothetical protein
VGFTEFFRHRIARWLEDQPAHDRDHHAEKHYRRSIVRNNVVNVPGFSRQSRHHKILRDPDNQHVESAYHQANKSGENEYMKNAGDTVTRMLPLCQPEFQDLAHPGQWPVKAKIPLGPQEWHQAHGHDIGKSGDAQKMNDQEQGPP